MKKLLIFLFPHYFEEYAQERVDEVTLTYTMREIKFWQEQTKNTQEMQAKVDRILARF